MEVKTGTLRNNLSRYLRQVREGGDSIVVMDRNKPIAEIRPYQGHDPKVRSGIWDIRRRSDREEGELDEDFELPERSTQARKHENPLG